MGYQLFEDKMDYTVLNSRYQTKTIMTVWVVITITTTTLIILIMMP